MTTALWNTRAVAPSEVLVPNLVLSVLESPSHRLGLSNAMNVR